MSSNRNVELHLLACLDALLQERQVTRAAERMNMTQPGMSNALAKLRQKLQDPLLVRTAHGMVPTERALQLEASVRAALRHVDAAFASPASFDPATARNTFKVAMSDYASMLFMPTIMNTLLREAPGMRMVIGPSDARRLRERLEEDGFDLCVGFYTEMPEDLHVSDVFRDNICCIARVGHPAFEGGITLENYVKQPQILMLGGTHVTTLEEQTDAVLKELGHSRNIVMWVPNQVTVPALVASSDLIATVPAELARRNGCRAELQVIALPFKVPDYQLTMVWHELKHHDAAHRWLRQQIRETAAGLMPPAPAPPPEARPIEGARARAMRTRKPFTTRHPWP